MVIWWLPPDILTERENLRTVASQGYVVSGQSSFTNKFIDAVSQQFHGIIDPYFHVDVMVMDSVLTKRLNDRYIYPDFVLSEVVDSIGNIVVKNTGKLPDKYDDFSYCFNLKSGLSYHIYMTPLTRHIVSEMSGVIITVFLCLAFLLRSGIYSVQYRIYVPLRR